MVDRHGLIVDQGTTQAVGSPAACDRGVVDELRVGDRNGVTIRSIDGSARGIRATAVDGLVAGKQAVEDAQVDTRIVPDGASPGGGPADVLAIALGGIVREGTLGQRACDPSIGSTDIFIANRATLPDAGVASQRLVARKGGECDFSRRSIQVA